ncbi:MAG: Hpt domain-containing protein [Rhodobacter sp.]|nr:Hpt domain-containing protein [Paracoccaceae bacterium]MCC0077651.1 Hpt domain-containing protein [Rhodobacter sp.]
MIDWAHVDELRNDMGDSFDEIVEVFLQEVEDALARLDPDAGAEAMAADLHFLKGAALNLGFSEFASLCASGEARANRGETAGIDPGRIRQAYTVSRHDFLDGLQRRAA